MASSISAARAALYAALDGHAWPGATTPQVVYGAPTAYEEQEVVALGGVVDVTEEFAALGAQRREETFAIRVYVKVHGPEDDAQVVDQRAWELHDAVRDAVNADVTLGGSVRRAIVSDSRNVGDAGEFGAVLAEGGGFVEMIQLTVSCAQRIT